MHNIHSKVRLDPGPRQECTGSLQQQRLVLQGCHIPNVGRAWIFGLGKCCVNTMQASTSYAQAPVPCSAKVQIHAFSRSQHWQQTPPGMRHFYSSTEAIHRSAAVYAQVWMFMVCMRRIDKMVSLILISGSP